MATEMDLRTFGTRPIRLPARPVSCARTVRRAITGARSTRTTPTRGTSMPFSPKRTSTGRRSRLALPPAIASSLHGRWRTSAASPTTLALGQAGLDIGQTTSTQWTANGLLPSGQTPEETPIVSRGVGPGPPPAGYRPGDLIFFGVDDGPSGHVAMWLGNGMIVQCSSSGDGSNVRPLSGYVVPTGWVRWNLG